ncbi:MAG: hydrogenase expression/formation protein HypE [Pseudodesulfovibrio sp.]|uniref:Hydrogenase expression/formation protein HypE n=1 Tax=Pseudodesulfovibrio aespoeensis (strain ATCC 700646 / DSM 10631 / Aspo-2) TaxID=643562 RepID=E6VTB8_PSEA9|nr:MULTISPECIES: hydrogenase expression/formation protein HypE [Pseudodesulfovibrio]MBU4191906.1 hydrogenase expression/formation protein HypE [Pseudomonadota bacterium]ADU63277.1 hydrogenase expression/formation protein HypE [Pseudodesulfovibrio aespoeensis Aspo-2]MBU4245332.1 hydrogenase expression/formation protein HypE [Pseudomonadota bacterium]MBU4378166.1 hydrogenase expression/formation protein HypE [Pseudomonadota bacterium]MBU4474985.1 hydrogenase expression/formation protein HypE [Ps
MSDKVLLDYGSGGRASQRLISELFLKHLGNDELNRLNDAAELSVSGRIAMSTDSFTVDPIFFPGGNIGSLAVHGTVNDVAMMGAVPRYMTCAYIIEEGLPMADLEKIVAAMGEAVREAGVLIVSGDTKVVPKGAVDKIFINTTGIGDIIVDPAPSGDRARPGDAVLISGTIGDHGLTILGTREGLDFQARVESDSASLNHLLVRLVRELPEVHVLRDPTRGGLATTLNEIAWSSNVCCELDEASLPVRPEVAGGCSILGLDPLYLANEGKFLCVLPGEHAEKALEIMRADPLGGDACRIGTMTDANPGKVVLITHLGGKRLLGMLEGEQLPRIC